MSLPSLTDLGNKHHTDKAYHHHFTEFYEPFIQHLRHEPINLFEIGVDTGASLYMWADYFANGRIYAIDIADKKYVATDEKNIFVEQGSQDDVHFLQHVFSGIMFDIIIDDGSHEMMHQQVSLREMFKRLKPGGLYILEDLHTSRMWGTPPHPTAGNVTTLQLLENMQNNQPNTGQFHIAEHEIQDICKQVESVQIHRQANHSITSIIKKLNTV